MLNKPVASDISVAIATMNRPEGVLRCLEGIRAGSVLPLEVVVIDQSGDDATERALGALNGWPVPLVYRRDAHRGLSRSRNLAVGVARGSIIAFTDDDCVPHREWVEAIERALRAPEIPDAITGRVLPLGPDRPGLFPVSLRLSERVAVFRGKTLPWKVGSGGNTTVRRGWLDQVGGFDERLGAGSAGRAAEDIDLLYRLLESGATIRYEPAVIIEHERQSRERRLASRPSYGYGTGFFYGIRLRLRDAYGLRMLLAWAAERAGVLVRSALRGRLWRVREERLMLGGLYAGLRDGIRLPSARAARAPVPSTSAPGTAALERR